MTQAEQLGDLSTAEGTPLNTGCLRQAGDEAAAGDKGEESSRLDLYFSFISHVVFSPECTNRRWRKSTCCLIGERCDSLKQHDVTFQHVCSLKR